MGSVKDLVKIEEPTDSQTGIARFIFSDRYSVFDWGEMPDHIPEKGSSICLATAYFFEELERRGIRTHYLGLVENDRLVRLDELQGPSNALQFKAVRVVHPKELEGGYDYSIYKREKGCFLIPLEIIYRNSLPEGSSVFKRIREGSLDWRKLGLSEEPKPGQILEKPILDVSTKLEASDRYMTWEEGQQIADLSDEELSKLKETVLAVNDLITEKTKPMGLLHEDGKVEFGFDEKREIMLVDALGTLDECRFSYQGIPVSKEIARIYYRKSAWFKQTEEAKKKDAVNWKALVTGNPEPMPEELVEGISLIYKAFTNELTGREWFPAPRLKDVLEKVKSMLPD